MAMIKRKVKVKKINLFLDFSVIFLLTRIKMSLYDDEDLGAPLTEVAKGWSTGIKMMQSHLQAKKLAPTSMGPPKSGFKDPITKHRTFSAPVLAPVIDLKSKKHIVDDPLTKSESRVC